MNKPKGYTDADMAEVSDNPEWTEAEIAAARPFAEIFSDLANTMDEPGRPKVQNKKLITCGSTLT